MLASRSESTSDDRILDDEIDKWFLEDLLVAAARLRAAAGVPVGPDGMDDATSAYCKSLRPAKQAAVHYVSRVNHRTRRGNCSHCGPQVPVLLRGRGRWSCKWAKQESDRAYDDRIKRAKDALMGPECEVCGTTKLLYLDHDHRTDYVRGTLCLTCNVVEGMLKHPERFRRFANYLEKKPSFVPLPGRKRRSRPWRSKP